MAKPATKETGTALVVTEEQKAAVALYQASVAEGDSGFEETTSADFSIPFLYLLQKTSPQCDPDKGEYIEAAKPGQFYDQATGELADSVDVIPCHYKHVMVEWADRDEGGGFKGQHPPGKEVGLDRDESGKFRLPNGNYLADTRYFFCQRVMPDGSTIPTVVSMASTQIKKAKLWMTRMQAIRVTGEGGKRFTPPMYANVWKLTSVPESNDKGSWRGYKIDLVGPITDPVLFQGAKDARSMFKAVDGLVKPPSDGGSEPKPASDDDIPFYA